MATSEEKFVPLTDASGLHVMQHAQQWIRERTGMPLAPPEASYGRCATPLHPSSDGPYCKSLDRLCKYGVASGLA